MQIYAGLCRFWKIWARGGAGVREGGGGLVGSGHSASYREGRRCAAGCRRAQQRGKRCVFEAGKGNNFFIFVGEGGAGSVLKCAAGRVAGRWALAESEGDAAVALDYLTYEDYFLMAFRFEG
jgi:hypothetical protein